MSGDEIIHEISKLSPKTGDMLVLRFAPNLQLSPGDVKAGLDSVRKELDAAGYIGVAIFLLDNTSGLYLLDEADMEKHGWVRKREQRGREFL